MRISGRLQFLTIVATAFVVANSDLRAAEKKREAIGEVLGKPVYRDEIRKEKGFSLKDELHRLFTKPVMDEYRRQHKTEVTPTPNEIEIATANIDRKHLELIKDREAKLRDELKLVEEELAKGDLPPARRKELEIKKRSLDVQLTPPGRNFAIFMLDNWKWQRHLYDKFGGGRILWQQGGIEAFDAMRTWLETQEKNGKFKITDPQLHAKYYEYWTTMKHGSFLTADKDRIRKEFLEPEWLVKKP